VYGAETAAWRPAAGALHPRPFLFGAPIEHWNQDHLYERSSEVNIDKDKWPQFERAGVATGANQSPLAEGALEADGGANQNGRLHEGVGET